MISYNTFANEAKNGWKNNGENNILLIQDPQGRPWGTTQSGISVSEMAQESVNAINIAWETLSTEIAKLDKVVIYVGSHGSEHAIKLAKESGLSDEKAIFVLCDCNQGSKERTIRDCGFENAKQIMCECGGRSTMGRMYSNFLSTGKLIE